MKKILSIFPIFFLLFLALPGSLSAASNVNITEVITTSNANHSPLGDCVGPDKKHFQTTSEVCQALNKAWGKGNGSFNVGVSTPSSSTNTLNVTAALEDSKINHLPAGDCVGPDKKHFQTTNEVCNALNKTWGKSNVSFNVGTPSPVNGPVTISEAIVVSQENGSPTGDCTGPDKKHFNATKEVCDALNHSWGKNSSPFNPGVSVTTFSGPLGSSGGSSSSVNSGGSTITSGNTSGGTGGSSGSSGGSTSTSTTTSSDKTKDKDKSKK